MMLCTALIFTASGTAKGPGGTEGVCGTCVLYAQESASSGETASSSQSLTNTKIEEGESAIKEAQDTKTKLQSGITNAQALIDSLKSSKDNVADYITKLDASMDDIQTKLDSLNEEISQNEIDIRETQQALEAAEAERDKQYDSMKQHIKYMYESQKETITDVLLSSADIGDLLNKSEYIEALSKYDDNKFAEFAATVKKVDDAKADLEDAKAELEKAQDDEKAEAASMQELIDAKQTEMNQYSATIGTTEDQVKEYKNMIAEQDAQIAALEAAVAAERKRLEEENKKARSYDGGMFAFPCPSYTRISDDFGMRMHPTLGVMMMHNGIDIAAPSGAPILAAYDGTVAAASYSATMGNYIMIDHGDSLFTVYMHASSLLVSAGQDVSKGQQIALVGSTGRSTGPHLHFGVRKDGSYVSPWNYLK